MISLPLILIGPAVLFWTRWRRIGRNWSVLREVGYYLVGASLLVVGGLLDVNARW